MSTDVAEFNGIRLTQFNAGFNKLSLQITDNHDRYIHINKQDTYLLIVALTKWIQEQAIKDKKRIQTIIAENKELEQTVLQVAVDCEKFIEQLELINVPLKLLELK